MQRRNLRLQLLHLRALTTHTERVCLISVASRLRLGDVVPVEPGTEDDWSYPPFAGRIAEGYIWGRGALDDKMNVTGLLAAVETLLEGGFQPRRTVHLAFGHDEEVGGEKGAALIGDLLKSRGVELEYVLDEGLVIAHGIVPSVPRPVAMVGIAEKGFVSIELSVEGIGGHSSMPPPETAVGILSTAVHKLEQNQFPAKQMSRVEVELNDGRTFTAENDFPKGDPREPMSMEDLDDKFASLADAFVSKEKQAAMKTAIWDLENTAKSVDFLKLFVADK